MIVFNVFKILSLYNWLNVREKKPVDTAPLSAVDFKTRL